MKRTKKIFSVFSSSLCILLSPSIHFSQELPKDKFQQFTEFPSRMFEKLDRESAKWEQKLDRQTEKFIRDLEHQEEKMKRKLQKKDSLAAKKIFAGGQDAYSEMKKTLKSPESTLSKYEKYYSGHFDSLKTTIGFLGTQQNQFADKLPVGELGQSLQSLQRLQGKFNNAVSVRKMIEQRKEFLRNKLQQAEFSKMLRAYREKAYYYQQQVEEYRNVLNDPEELGKRLLSEVRKLSLFSDFFKKYSEIAALFPEPEGYGSPQALAGLQTQRQVQQLIQNQVISGGSNAQSVLQQNIQAAQSQLSLLKDKVSQLGGSGGDISMPNFKPNSQKTKTFLQRLEYGTNFQTQKANYFFPTTTDMALTVGYRLSERNVVGLGISYKMGWGKDIHHVAISSEGIGFRSFIDFKIKGSFFLSGGLEYNYQEAFNSFQDIKGIKEWSNSGLIGVSKILSVKSKVLKKTKIQLLWDFLSYYQAPRTNPLKFRVGYGF